MSTKIEWTDETWNPVTGCTKVSQGCKHCYAERLAPKVFAGQMVQSIPGLGRLTEGVFERKRVFTDVVTHPDRLDAPLHWKKPRRIFVNSMSDLFHEDVPFEFIDQVFGVMAITTRHTYQILTKRAQRMREYIQTRTDFVYDETGDRLPELLGCPNIISDASVAARRRTNNHGYDNCGPLWPLENVWLGVSVEDQETADERIPLLLRTPAAVRFLSCEPLLGPIDLTDVGQDRDGYGFTVNVLTGEADAPKCVGALMSRPAISWVIAGGESGPKARPSHPDWFRSLRDQCAGAHVPFFFKQWGEWGEPDSIERTGTAHHGWWEENWEDGGVQYFTWRGRVVNGVELAATRPIVYRIGKKHAGRMLDGREHMEWPA